MPSEFIENLNNSVQSSKEMSEEIVAKMMGLALFEMDETIILDIEDMLKKDKIQAIDGYVFCLYRMINHERALNLIKAAFKKAEKEVPNKYVECFSV